MSEHHLAFPTSILHEDTWRYKAFDIQAQSHHITKEVYPIRVDRSIPGYGGVGGDKDRKERGESC